jgi:autotransporter-associated beta strand protein
MCRRRGASIIGAIILLCGASLPAQIPAFPGALGFGANATGGRAGSVYHVTTLADSGPGSFRDAVGKSGRIVVFDVGGYINLSSAISMKDNLTIAGQTAPGDGIGVMGREVSFNNSENVIVRHFRFRQGDLDPDNQKSGINLLAATNIMLDHISIEFAQWNNIDALNCDKVTMQNSINADPIGQQFGAHIEHLNSSCALLYNLWANAHNRQPLASINTVHINNVVYNYEAAFTTHTSGFFLYDLINNYFITGPATSNPDDDFFQVDAQQSIYFTGNLRDSNEDGVLNGAPTAPGGVVVLTAPWSSLTTNIPTFTTAAGFRYDVSAAGAWPRDQVDNLVVGQIKTLGSGSVGTGAGTAGPGGSQYTSQSQTGLGNGGYGILNGGLGFADSDGDGMPDYWEKAVGLNFLSASDALTIAADGYANIEHYLNWLGDLHALTITNVPVDVDLWPYTSGFTNVSPVYTVDNASNGVVSLISGHIAHFAPNANFAGLGSFRFSVVASDGTAYTNAVNILVTTVTQPTSLMWRGDGINNLWAIGSGTNWFDGTNLVAFNSGDNVTFDDTGSNAPAINLSGLLPAGTISVIANQDYTFGGSGALSGSASLFKVGAGNLFINTTNTFNGGVTINEGTVQLGDGVNFSGSIGGNITNHDTLVFNNPGSVSSSANISGDGLLIKNGAGPLTLTGTQTYTNLTTINAGSLQFSGSIPPGDITNNASLILVPSASTTYANTISGSGNLTTSPGGILTVSGTNTFSGNTTNTSGILLLAQNQAAGSGTVIYTGGAVQVANGVVITNNFTIPSSTSDLSMMCSNGNTGTWAGNVVNLGSSASWRPGSDGGTLIFTGTALQGTRNFIVPRGTFQIAANAVISATGSATAFGRDTSSGNRSANVTIRDSAVVTLGVCNLGGGQAGGNVTLTIQNNAVLTCGANNFDLQNVNRATAATTLRLNGGTMTVGGFTKTKTSQTNTIQFNGGVLKAGANNISFLPAFSFATNAVQSGGAIVDDDGFAITIAAPLIHDPALGSTPDGGFTKMGSGALTLNDPNTYNGPTVIRAGTLVLGGATVANPLAATTNIYVAAGATLDASAESPFPVANGRTLWGNGFVIGRITISANAILSPGSNSIGTLTFSNSLTLAAGSTNIFEISKSPLTNDLAKIIGALTNGGTLIVTHVDPPPLALGDSFKLFDAASYSGSFANVVLPSLDPGLAWNKAFLNTAGTISVAAVTPPLIETTTLNNGNLVLSGSGGVPATTFYVLASTNVALPLNEWPRLLTNQFDLNGHFVVTNAVNPALPGLFYLLQVP